MSQILIREVPDLEWARQRATGTASRRAIDIEVLEAHGIDYIADEIASGLPFTTVATELGVLPVNLAQWIARDPIRTERITQARRVAATLRLDTAELELATVAADRDSVARAKLRIEQSRWVAARLDPDTYGDRIRQEIVKPQTPEEIERELMRELEGLK